MSESNSAPHVEQSPKVEGFQRTWPSMALRSACNAARASLIATTAMSLGAILCKGDRSLCLGFNMFQHIAVVAVFGRFCATHRDVVSTKDVHVCEYHYR